MSNLEKTLGYEDQNEFNYLIGELINLSESINQPSKENGEGLFVNEWFFRTWHELGKLGGHDYDNVLPEGCDVDERMDCIFDLANSRFDGLIDHQSYAEGLEDLKFDINKIWGEEVKNEKRNSND